MKEQTISYKDVLARLSPPSTPVPLIAQDPPKLNHPDLSAQIAALELHPTLEALLHILNGDLFSAHFLARHMEDVKVPPKFEGMALHAILHRIEGDINNARCWYHDIRESEVFEKCWLTSAQLPSSSNNGASTTSTQEQYPEGANSQSDEPIPKHVKSYQTLPPYLTDFLNRIAAHRQVILHTPHHILSENEELQREKSDLEQISWHEISSIREFCERKFGTERYLDASAEFASDIEYQQAEKERKKQNGEETEDEEDKVDIKNRMLVGGEGFRVF